MNAHSLVATRASASIPVRTGVGLKPEHYRQILEDQPAAGWFEAHPENYMGAGGPAHHFLERIRERYPLSLHGVGLSIGGAGPLDKRHLQRIKALVERYEPGLFSEHLAWSSHGGAYANDLLPLPYAAATLAHVATHVDELQQTLGRRVLIENPSSYIAFASSEMGEPEFLAELARRAGCGLLLDVNNVYVSSVNLGFDAKAYIDAFAVEHVGEIHLAGHCSTRDDLGARLLIDAHDRPISDAVWELYAHALRRCGPVPTLIEWDNEIPELAVLLVEAATADRLMVERRTNDAQPH